MFHIINIIWSDIIRTKWLYITSVATELSVSQVPLPDHQEAINLLILKCWDIFNLHIKSAATFSQIQQAIEADNSEKQYPKLEYAYFTNILFAISRTTSLIGLNKPKDFVLKTWIQY
jgi:hypothetical protein